MIYSPHVNPNGENSVGHPPGYQHYFSSNDSPGDRAAWVKFASGGTYEDDILAPMLAGAASGALKAGVRGIVGGLFRGAAEDVVTIGSGTAMGQIANVVERATALVGEDVINVSSEDLAQQAADSFLGEGSKPITQLYGNRAGQVIGRKSADGLRIVRIDKNVARPHYNFVNKATGGNLHVYF